MCGIAGWMDFERDLTRERAIVQAMTETLRERGPDDRGARGSRATRRWGTAVWPSSTRGRTPAHGGRGGRAAARPCSSTAARSTTSASCARIDRRSGTPSAPRAIPRWCSEAWRQWGPRVPPSGSTACSPSPSGTCASRRCGSCATAWASSRCTTTPRPTGCCSAPSPRRILAHPHVRAELDDDGLRELLAFLKTPGHALLKGLREVRPGHVLRVRRGALRARPRTGSSRRGPTRMTATTTVRTVRELLEDTVSRQLVSDVPLCLLLSGGLDSSVLTALAQRSLSAQGTGRVRSFSVDFVGPRPRLHPGRPSTSPRRALRGGRGRAMSPRDHTGHRPVLGAAGGCPGARQPW